MLTGTKLIAIEPMKQRITQEQSVSARQINKTIKYDKKCRMRRTVEPSLKMSQPRLKRQKSGKWAFFTSLSFV